MPQHKLVKLREVKQGEYVRLVAFGPVWIRGEYQRIDKRFMLDSFDDTCRFTSRKGDTLVYVGFTF